MEKNQTNKLRPALSHILSPSHFLGRIRLMVDSTEMHDKTKLMIIKDILDEWESLEQQSNIKEPDLPF